jgi:Tfp pilus assembly protein PilF
VHAGLGTAMERKGDESNALEQYRIALKLNPNDSTIRANYERLMRQVRAKR